MMFFPKKVLPETWAVFGIFSILLSCFIGFLSVKELAGLPSEPQHMLISEALSKVSEKRLWVILDDIQWHCDHVYFFERNKSGDDTYILFTDKNNTVLGLGLFNGKKECEAVVKSEVSGVLDVGVKGTDGATLSRSLTESGVDVSFHEKNGTFLFLCTYCGRENSSLGLVLSLFFLISGIMLFLPLIKSTKARKSANRFMKRDILRL